MELRGTVALAHWLFSSQSPLRCKLCLHLHESWGWNHTLLSQSLIAPSPEWSISTPKVNLSECMNEQMCICRLIIFLAFAVKQILLYLNFWLLNYKLKFTILHLRSVWDYPYETLLKMRKLRTRTEYWLRQSLIAASGRVEAPGSPDFLLVLIPVGCAEHDKIRLKKKKSLYLAPVPGT